MLIECLTVFMKLQNRFKIVAKCMNEKNKAGLIALVSSAGVKFSPVLNRHWSALVTIPT